MERKWFDVATPREIIKVHTTCEEVAGQLVEIVMGDEVLDVKEVL